MGFAAGAAGALTLHGRDGYSLRVDYTQLLRSLREARGLTLEQLAQLARVHRNTVVNIESGRQVKFKTIAALMRKMGYADDSSELRSMGLLWLESVSGIPFSRPDAEPAVQKTIAAFRGIARDRAAELQRAIGSANLTPERIDLLTFATRHPEILSIIEAIRDLSIDLSAQRNAPVLKAAEAKARYGGRKRR